MRTRLTRTRLAASVLVLFTTLLTPGTAHAAPGPYVYIESVNTPGFCIRHYFFLGELSPCNTTSFGDRTFTQTDALSQAWGVPSQNTVSYESVNFPGWYLRHENLRIKLAPKPPAGDPTARQFALDASFRRVAPLVAHPYATSFESVNFPGMYIRHADFHLYLSSNNSPIMPYDATFQVWIGQ